MAVFLTIISARVIATGISKVKNVAVWLAGEDPGK
jgi:hypothetical protein